MSFFSMCRPVRTRKRAKDNRAVLASWKSVRTQSRERESGEVWWCQAMGQKLMHRKLHLNRRIIFFTVRVTAHWNRLPRERVKSLSLDILKNCLDEILYHGL